MTRKARDMDTLLTLLMVLTFGMFPVFVITKLLRGKGNLKNIPLPISIFPQTTRYREGAISYTQDRSGVRTNVEVENPYESHNARYQRRHSARRHKQTKPWMR